METQGVQIGKKGKKNTKKMAKSPVLPSVSAPEGSGIPAPRFPSGRFEVKVQGHSQRTYLKEISFKLPSSSPVASQSHFPQGAVVKIPIHQWQSSEPIPVPEGHIPVPGTRGLLHAEAPSCSSLSSVPAATKRLPVPPALPFLGLGPLLGWSLSWDGAFPEMEPFPGLPGDASALNHLLEEFCHHLFIPWDLSLPLALS